MPFAILESLPLVPLTILNGQNILAVLVFLVPFIIFAAMAVSSRRNHRHR